MLIPRLENIFRYTYVCISIFIGLYIYNISNPFNQCLYARARLCVCARACLCVCSCVCACTCKLVYIQTDRQKEMECKRITDSDREAMQRCVPHNSSRKLIDPLAHPACHFRIHPRPVCGPCRLSRGSEHHGFQTSGHKSSSNLRFQMLLKHYV